MIVGLGAARVKFGMMLRSSELRPHGMPTVLTHPRGPWRPGDLDDFLALGLNNLLGQNT
jgi:hypothetical protein